MGKRARPMAGDLAFPVPIGAGDVFHLGPLALRLGHTGEKRVATGSYRLAVEGATPTNGKEQLSAAFGAMLEMEAPS